MYYNNNNQPSIPTYHHQGGIHGNLLEVTVVGCNKLKDTEWISRQDPYVCVEYGSSKNRTRVCTDGGKNPTFQERFVYTLIEGLTELNVIVMNKNTLSHDYFIGSGRIQLGKVLSQGFDDSFWPLQTKTGRHAGEVRLIMHYSSANKPVNSYAPSYGTSNTPQVSMYAAPPPHSSVSYPPQSTSSMSYPPPPATSIYPPVTVGGYPAPSSYSSYSYPPSTTNLDVYPLPPDPYPPPAAPYPPQPYPLDSVYPPQPAGSFYPHGSQYPGVYPPPY